MSTILQDIETQIAGLKTSTTKSNTGIVREAGDGVYRGAITLVCGGRFQVTVRVRQREKIVASRQLTVQAEGAM